MRGFRLSRLAATDILEVLIWSEHEFGEGARLRYERLIEAALADILEDPLRLGSHARPELGAGVRSWHLRLSRERARTPEGVVRRARHVVIYRNQQRLVVVGRLLHDAMELARHLREPWE